MADRGNTAQQILQCTPPEAHGFGYAQMLANGTAIGMIDVARPFTGIRIGAAAQLRKKVEFQMVVRVDQTGKHEVAGEIEGESCPYPARQQDRWRGASRGEELGLSGGVKEWALGFSNGGIGGLDKLQVGCADSQLIQRIGVILQFVDLAIAAEGAAPALRDGGGVKVGEQEGAAAASGCERIP